MVATRPNPELMSADEFQARHAGQHVELVEGLVHEMTPAGAQHGAVAGEIFRRLANHVRKHRCGRVFAAETGFVLRQSPATVRAADAAYVSSERLRECPISERFFASYPDIAVEVVSPRDTWSDVTKKVGDYLQAGTSLVWVVAPESRTVTVHGPDAAPRRLGEQGELTGEAVLPAFRCPVAALFE